MNDSEYRDADIRRLQQYVRDESARTSAALDERDGAMARVNQLQQEILDQRAQLASLRSALADAEKRADEAASVARQLDRSYREACRKLDEQVVKLRGLRQGKGEREREISRLKARIAELEAETCDPGRLVHRSYHEQVVEEATAELEKRIAELKYDATSDNILREAIDNGLRSVGAPETSWSNDYEERVEQIVGAYHAECDEHAATKAERNNALERIALEAITPRIEPSDEELDRVAIDQLTNHGFDSFDDATWYEVKAAARGIARAVLALTRPPEGAVSWSERVKVSDYGRMMEHFPDVNEQAALAQMLSRFTGQFGALHHVFVPTETKEQV